jgi:hypothetical protein
MRRIFVLATLLVVSYFSLFGSHMAPSVSTFTAVHPYPICDGSMAPC